MDTLRSIFNFINFWVAPVLSILIFGFQFYFLKKKIPHTFYMKELRQEVDKISGNLNAYIAFCETNKLDAKKLRELDIELDFIRHQYSEALSRRT